MIKGGSSRRTCKGGKRHSRGGSMAGRLAVPAGFLLLQKLMHSRKKHKKSAKKPKTKGKRKGKKGLKRK